MHILVVEDDPVLADALLRALRKADYAVDVVKDGLAADHILTTAHFDLVILDLGLPKLDGLEVLRRLRQRANAVPVLILTAQDSLENRVKGLDMGADDYLSKPFQLRELEARARALIRRGHSGMGAQLKCGMLTFDTTSRLATLDGKTLDLSVRELCVLETLMLQAGKVVGKDMLGEQLSSAEEDLSSNAIEVYVHRLRKKLEDSDVNIRTLRGLGYLLVAR